MTEARVLLVGDDESLAAALDAAGHAVTRADTAHATLEGVRAGSYDCVLVPLDAGPSGAFDLARALDDAAPLLPTIVVGDRPASAVARPAIDAPVATYLQRPDGESPPAELSEAVADAATTRRERRDAARVADDGPIGTCTVREGTIVRADRRFAELAALTDDPEGRELLELVAAADRPAVRAALEAATATDTEAAWFAPVGDRSRTMAAYLRRTDDGVVCSVLDDTERADRIDGLEADSEMLDSLLGNVPLSIYFKDRQGRHERVSRYITKTDPDEFIRNDEGKVHPHPDDVIGKTDFDLYAPEFAEATDADDGEVMERGEPIVDEIEAGTTILGEDLYTSTTKAPRYDEDGDVVGLVGVTVDVTDRIKHRQELERQNERLDEFAEVLTHDLRNPVQIAQGYLETVQRAHDTENVRACGEALDRIGSLIDEIREFVLEGRTVDDPEPVDLEETARAAWSTVQTDEATFEVEGELRLRADPARLRRLLENLFRNAVEHGSTSSQNAERSDDAVEHGSTSPRSQTREDAAGASSGEPSAADEQSSSSPGSQARQDAGAAEDAVEHGSTSNRNAERSDDAVEHETTSGSDLGEDLTVRVRAREDGFVVADDGVGLPEDSDADVFERGFTTDADGTGFGLAIVANIAGAHGWTVEAGESDDGGAAFEISDVVRAEGGLGQHLADRS